MTLLASEQEPRSAHHGGRRRNYTTRDYRAVRRRQEIRHSRDLECPAPAQDGAQDNISCEPCWHSGTAPCVSRRRRYFRKASLVANVDRKRNGGGNGSDFALAIVAANFTNDMEPAVTRELEISPTGGSCLSASRPVLSALATSRACREARCMIWRCHQVSDAL